MGILLSVRKNFKVILKIIILNYFNLQSPADIRLPRTC